MSDRLFEVSETGLVPLFALPDVCLLPGESLPFFIFEPRYRQMLKDALSGEGLIALARLKPGYEADYNGNPPVFPCMGVGEIVAHRWASNGTAEVVLRGVARTRLAEVVKPFPYRLGRLVDLPETEGEIATTERHEEAIQERLEPLTPEFATLHCDLETLVRAEDGPWRLALLLDLSAGDKQSLLESDSRCERLGILSRALAEPDQVHRVRVLLRAIERQRERDEREPPAFESEAGL